jgi:hypothetical protein
MDQDQVITTLDSLANGLDPTTGSRIPHDLFQSPDVIRALFAAANLLRERPTGARATPPASRPASAGARWNDEEDALLCREFDAGTPISDIARQHGRTSGAITSRLVKLGRIAPDAVKVRERGARVAGG